MFDEASARRDLEARQQLRKGAALPPLDIDAELKRMREQNEEADSVRAFEQWQADNPELVKAIRQQSLNDLRAEWGKAADWRPTGVLSGGGLWFDRLTNKRVRAAFAEARHHKARARRFVWGPEDLEHQ